MIKFLLSLSVILLLIGCGKDQEDNPAPEKGKISLSLETEIIEETLGQGRIAVNSDTFKVVVQLESGVVVVEYDNASEVPEFITLDPGSYKVKAYSENENQAAAFESPYYYGESGVIDLGPGQTENISVTCKVANCGVKINYSTNIQEQFDSYSTEVSNASGTLIYNEGETRIGFFDLSPISIEATLNYETFDGSPRTKTLTGTIENPIANKLYEVQFDASTSRISIDIVLDEVMISEVISINEYTSACETDGYAVDNTDPIKAAEVMGLCYGVEDAQWVQPDGSPAPSNTNFDIGHGIIETFGSNVPSREGSNMLLLSTGAARLPGHGDYNDDFDKGYVSTVPLLGTNYSCESGNYNLNDTGVRNDGIGLKLTLNPPETAIGFSFDLKYYTRDNLTTPLACSYYYDESGVIVSPVEGSISVLPANGNVTFDSFGNTISTVTTMDVCNGCPSGTNELQGTGFETKYGTKWLTTTVPLETCTKFTIVFGIWDNGDGVITSSILYDNFRWIYHGDVTLETSASL